MTEKERVMHRRLVIRELTSALCAAIHGNVLKPKHHPKDIRDAVTGIIREIYDEGC